MTSTALLRSHTAPISDFSQSLAEITESATPYVREGETLRFMPELMEVERPYPVLIGEWQFIAMKDGDGDISFFYLR